MMNGRHGGRVTIHQGASIAPSPAPPSPQFVSCERLPTPPPPPPPRRTVYEIFENICYYVSIVCAVLFLLDLLLQVVTYGYLQSPGGRSAASGQQLTHYDILGVKRGAGQHTITAGWRWQSRTFHPDRVEGGNTEETRERYYWIQLAYVELSDPLARCYHDQYHGLLPRKWGQDDPCTKILMKIDRESRIPTDDATDAARNEMLGKLEKEYGMPLDWLKATKIKRNGREWKNLGWLRQKEAVFWEKFGYYGGKLLAWQYIAVGFVLAMIERYWGYLAEFGKWHFHEVRYEFNQLLEDFIELWEEG
ncbi:DnaJ domain-containing protein [Diaporthe helianthi]|uniref:DnaJ domain-containing protein n=1 Tax=Diaporthe helianthi TaxID=158607 RepID=A0A2P5IA30_DIAHE|nr:DnaJ domain-containing protein [Diaporthe helianthi]